MSIQLLVILITSGKEQKQRDAMFRYSERDIHVPSGSTLNSEMLLVTAEGEEGETDDRERGAKRDQAEEIQ